MAAFQYTVYIWPKLKWCVYRAPAAEGSLPMLYSSVITSSDHFILDFYFLFLNF